MHHFSYLIVLKHYVYKNLFLFTMLSISYEVFDSLGKIKIVPLFPITLIDGMSISVLVSM